MRMLQPAGPKIIEDAVYVVVWYALQGCRIYRIYFYSFRKTGPLHGK